jgi:hypothetical protein
MLLGMGQTSGPFGHQVEFLSDPSSIHRSSDDYVLMNRLSIRLARISFWFGVCISSLPEDHVPFTSILMLLKRLVENMNFVVSQRITFLVPIFHVQAHSGDCLWLYHSPGVPDLGRVDGECCERAFAHMGKFSYTTRSMSHHCVLALTSEPGHTWAKLGSDFGIKKSAGAYYKLFTECVSRYPKLFLEGLEKGLRPGKRRKKRLVLVYDSNALVFCCL